VTENEAPPRGGPDGVAREAPRDHTVRLPTEGVDLLTLAGVNDANLVELARITGARVALRGEALTLAGATDGVDRAALIGRRMIDLARQRVPLGPDDVLRISLDPRAARRAARAGATRRATRPTTWAGRRCPARGARGASPCRGRADDPGQDRGAGRVHGKIAEHDIVVGIGPAGTGKTYLAVAMAVDALVRKRVRRIVLARPAVEAGESLGFLPGDMQAKVDPYLRPLYDALDEMMPPERVAKALETRTIEIAPLAFMRGRTLGRRVRDPRRGAERDQPADEDVPDAPRREQQDRHHGDKTQIDLPKREDSGLMQVERILHGIEGIAFHYFSDADVVRHRLVRDIIRAYADDAG
jgi:phosphate starvation-inducible PhoH-like protein